MSKKNWQWLFLTGAAFNLLVTAAFVFAPRLTLDLFGFGAPPADVVWYALFWWLVAVFGIGYYMVSRDPAGNRGIAMMGLIGKLGVWLIMTVLWVMGHAPLPFMILVCVDLMYSLLFLWFLRDYRAAVR